jgi:outer membrane protein
VPMLALISHIDTAVRFVLLSSQLVQLTRERFKVKLRLSNLRSVLLRTMLLITVQNASSAVAQTAPISPDHSWHTPEERKIEEDAKQFSDSRFNLDLTKTYSLADLIDLAEMHNPDTRVAWQRALSRAAALRVARAELYPTLAAAALSQVNRAQDYFGTRFSRKTTGDFDVALDLNYLIFDFGGRSGRIDAASAKALATNFAFNDTHRHVIYAVEEAYYQLLTTIGQEDAAGSSLSNAKTVQQAAEERLKNGLATLPDVLEAKSATAQADFELQAVLGQEEIARGNLATALGASPTTAVRVEPLAELRIPESISDTVEQAIDRALVHRPDLLEQVAQLRAAKATVKEARSAFYPSLSFSGGPTAQSLYGLQQTFPWGHTAGLNGGLEMNLNWTVFDGGARKNRLVQAKADLHATEAQVNSVRDQLADQVWTAYSNLNTAFRQRQAANALLEAATQSYAAALESYNYGLRNLLDVTAAQRTLAQARSTDVRARTQVLASLADLAFQTADSIQPSSKKLAP